MSSKKDLKLQRLAVQDITNTQKTVYTFQIPLGLQGTTNPEKKSFWSRDNENLLIHL